MRLGPSKTFRLLSVAAAQKADIPLPACDLDDEAQLDKVCQFVAESTDGVAARQQAWIQYEDRLRDHRTYALDDIRAWLADEWKVTVGRSSIDRDRKRIIQAEKVNQLSNQRLKSALDMMKDLPDSDLFGGGTRMIAQMILSNLLNYSAESLENLKPAQIIAMMDVFARTSKGYAETLLIEERRKLQMQQREAFDREAKKAMGGSRDGKISPAQLEQIRKSVFGEAAA